METSDVKKIDVDDEDKGIAVSDFHIEEMSQPDQIEFISDVIHEAMTHLELLLKVINRDRTVPPQKAVEFSTISPCGLMNNLDHIFEFLYQ